MKKLINTLILAILTISLSAQSKEYKSSMTISTRLLDSALSINNNEMLQELSVSFKEIGDLHKNEWLPYYYAAYCHINMGFNEAEQYKIELEINHAENFILIADSLSPYNSEISCLKSLIATGRIIADPMKNGYRYGEVVTNCLKDAKKENPENPRVYYLIGQSLLYMPAEYGGGYANAKPYYELASNKYNNSELSNGYAPHWGKKENLKLLKEASY